MPSIRMEWYFVIPAIKKQRIGHRQKELLPKPGKQLPVENACPEFITTTEPRGKTNNNSPVVVSVQSLFSFFEVLSLCLRLRPGLQKLATWLEV